MQKTKKLIKTLINAGLQVINKLLEKTFYQFAVILQKIKSFKIFFLFLRQFWRFKVLTERLNSNENLQL